MKKTVIIGAILMLLIIVIQTEIIAQDTHPFPASPIYSSVMQSFRIDNDGRFRLYGGYGYFFTHKKGSIKVLRDGKEIAEYSFRVSPSKLPKYEYDGINIVSGKNDVLGLYIKKSGNYELAFYMGGKKFYSFPFSLNLKASSDPYSQKKTIIANGDWNDYAYFYQSSRSNRLTFNAFFRSETGQPQPSRGKVIVRRDRDKKVVAFYQTRFRREVWWTKQSFILNSSGRLNSKGEYFDTKEWDSSKDKFADGNYTVTLEVSGKHHGTYKFSVKGGKIQYQGRQVRGKTEPIRFIEGGRTQFWVKRIQE